MNHLKSLLKKALCLSLGALLAALGLYLHQALSGPPLRPWHQWKAAAEFHSRRDTISDFSTYLRLEKELFRELGHFRDTLDAPRLSRYSPNNPLARPIAGIDWNQSVELPAEPARGAVLMLHGMSDSPYSLRALARAFQQQGFQVLVLRLPGHGTVPSALTRFSWEDMTRAVQLAATHLRPWLRQGRPLILVGYSNGATLALDYSLTALEQDDLVIPAGLVLISPAIAVSPAAQLSWLILFASRLPGLDKLAWLSRQPEYDPYKYNSFAVNAGYQVHLLTKAVQLRLEKLPRPSTGNRFPPVLAIQSVVDTTVSAPAVVSQLMTHLHSGKDELLLFDINREADIIHLFADSDHHQLERLMTTPSSFHLTLVTNRTPGTAQIHALQRTPRADHPVSIPLALEWPPGIYSLSHVALPIPPRRPPLWSGVGRSTHLG